MDLRMDATRPALHRRAFARSKFCRDRSGCELRSSDHDPAPNNSDVLPRSHLLWLLFGWRKPNNKNGSDNAGCDGAQLRVIGDLSSACSGNAKIHIHGRAYFGVLLLWALVSAFAACLD